MVAAGVPTPDEAAWLGSLRTRNLAIAEARRFGGKQAGDSLKKFAHQVVELAFARDRVDRGSGDPRIIGSAARGDLRAVCRQRGITGAAQCAIHQCAASSVRRRVPTSAVPDTDLERHVEGVRAAHLVADQLLERLALAVGYLEQ